MKILIHTPAAKGSLKGNRITAKRWARIFRELKHQVDIYSTLQSGGQYQRYDALIALHAVKSAVAIKAFASKNPNAKIFLALSGTDIYDSSKSKTVQASMALADRIIVLNEDLISRLSKTDESKAIVVLQSAFPPSSPTPALKRNFEVVVAGHLRPVKDPFLTVEATNHLPATSRILVTHVGGALSSKMKKTATRLTRINARYRWIGERSHGQSKRLIDRAKLLVVTSKIEGGAAVISEALVAGTPILATRISGNVGQLGSKYPGLFEVGNSKQLAELLEMVETDVKFYNDLKSECRKLAKKYRPAKELGAWKKLLREISWPLE